MPRIECRDIVSGAVDEVVIEQLDTRGMGVVELQDGRLVVSGALPGERVRIRVRQHDRDYEEGRLVADVVDVLEASDDRRDPLCERDEVCRGCQLRHMTIASELEYKARIVSEAVDDYGGLDADDQPDVEIVTPQPIARGDAFRIRTRLTYRREGRTFELGLKTPVRSGLVPMHDCPALTEPVRRLVDTVRTTLQRAGGRLPDGDEVDGERGPGLAEIRVVSPTHGAGLIDVRLSETDDRSRFEARILEDPMAGWLEKLGEEVPDQVGVAVSSGDHREEVVGPDRIRIPVGRWNMLVGYDDWFHSTLEPADRVYETTMEWLQLRESDRVLDIGCATGPITLMTSEYVDEVVGVDINPASIEAAELNAVAHRRDNVRFLVAGWQKALRELAMDDETFSVATIHPTSRALGRRVLAFLDVLQIRRLVYLGPAPEAAARDIGVLRQQEWEITKLGAGNLDPASSEPLLMAGMEGEGG